MVNLELILNKGLARKNSRMLKILGEGALDRKLVVEAHRFSGSAREKILQAGGEVKVLSC